MLRYSPSFFLKTSFLKTNGHTDNHQEAHIIYEHAVGVDNLWVLNKTDGNFLCENFLWLQTNKEQQSRLDIEFFLLRGANDDITF